ncbi:histidine kinase, partial [Streptomyces longwoodensis]
PAAPDRRDERTRPAGPPAPRPADAPPAGQPGGPDGTTAGPPAHGPGSAPGGLPRRVRQANLAPQLREGPARRTADRPELADRDADDVRSRMASLQRGWQRGRAENAEGDDAHRGTAPQGTKGDGR